jgi:ATP-dependent Zn protease
MDGFGTSEQVLVIGASNLAKVLDPAIMRPGRFDRKFKIPMPDKKDRQKLIEYHYFNAKKNKKFSFNSERLALQTVGFSPADLANLVNSALIESYKNKQNANDKMFRIAFEKIVTGVRRKSLSNSDKEKYLIALRHAAMASVAFLRKSSIDYSFISLLPRDDIDGQIRTACITERVFENEDQILAAIDVSLACREAEEFYFGQDAIAIGSSKYLSQAGELAYLHSRLYGKGMLTQGKVDFSSQQYRESLDNEVSDLIQKRKQIVKSNIELMDSKIIKLANKLIEKEAMTKKEVEKILNNRLMPW